MGVCSSSLAFTSSADAPFVLPTFKVALVGDHKVGKTAIFNRFVKNQYSKVYLKTKNVDIANITKMVNVPDHVLVSFTLWDTPASDDVDLTPTYYKNLDAAIVVIDVSDERSMEMAGYWRQQVVNGLTKYSGLTTTEAYKVPVLLLANKYDKVDKNKPKDISNLENFKETLEDKSESDNSDELKISLDDCEKWKPECVERLKELETEHRFLAGILVSAKESDNSVHLAMQTLIRNLIDHYLQSLPERKSDKPKKKKVKTRTEEEKEKTILKFTAVETIDTHVKHCEKAVNRISELKASYEKTLDMFKIACADAEIIPADRYSKASLEQCITALKLHVGTGEELIYEENSVGMTELKVDSPKQLAKGEVGRAIEIFNQCYAAVCTVVLIEYETLKALLSKYDRKILESETELWNSENYQAVSSIVQANRVQIGESLLWIEELYKHSERARDKVKAALAW